MSGSITRYRKTKKTTEISTIEHLFCVENFMTSDEERNLVLTKFYSKKGVNKLTESDHNVMWCNFKLQWSTFIKTNKKEVFN